MDQPSKHRAKSAPVITEAYVQNKREDECLCEKLDSIQYQHYANLIRLRESVSHIARQKKILLSQRAISRQSSLDHVLDEICTYKNDKHCSSPTKSHLPSSTEVYVSRGSNLKWPPPYSQSLPSASHNIYAPVEGKPLSQISASRAQDKADQRPRAASSLQRSPHSTMPLTYKELSGIARLENVSMREAERRKQQIQLEKQNLSRLSDSTLRERVHNFLKKLE
ncbi:uncharacterized protein PAF06_007411 [Gastrophryne carolinensis]